MMEVTIDGEKMTSKKQAHRYIKYKLNSGEYHGKNLDALWDVISTYDTSIKIKLINIDKLIENLEDYGENIIKVFLDAERENNNINLVINKS